MSKQTLSQRVSVKWQRKNPNAGAGSRAGAQFSDLMTKVEGTYIGLLVRVASPKTNH